MKKIINNCLIYAVLLVMLFSFYKVTIKHYHEKEEKKKVSFISEIYEETEEENNFLDYYRKLYSNDDIVGILKIESIGIDTLLVQGVDNDFYLKHLITKEPSNLGAVFVDYRTKLDESKQINIYGHNSKKVDIPFRFLEKYLDKKTYEENKYITLITQRGISIYEIFSVNIVRDDKEHMSIDYETRLEWGSHFNRLRKGSLYETDTVVDGDDEILVMQTCLNNNPKGNLLILNSRKEKN